MGETKRHTLTLRIADQDVDTELALVQDPEQKPRNLDVEVPFVTVRVNRIYPLGIFMGPLSEWSEQKRGEILLYGAPLRAERLLPSLLPKVDHPQFKQRWELLDAAEACDVIKAKESTGETYEQRSRLCFSDLCRIAKEIWYRPRKRNPEFDPHVLNEHSLKRRIYEAREWMVAIRWGGAKEYWSPHPRPGKSGVYVINGAKMDDLSAQLSPSGLGVLPEIVGRVEIVPAFTFLQAGTRDALERDCKEINEAAKVGAAKAVIVLCASVVEALLYDFLKNKEKEAKATAGQLASDPLNVAVKGHLERAAKRPLDTWSAFPIIRVARELAPEVVSEDAASHAHVLRDYRNLIHPGKAERSEKRVDQYTAAIAIQVVNLIVRGRREAPAKQEG